MNRGYVKVWRKIEDSGLIQLPNTLALFMHLLLNATHKDRKMGTPSGVIDVKRGQFVSGRIELASRLKQSEQQIRTSLKRLEDLEIISINTTNRYSVYTIENYSKYQDTDEASNQQTTNKQPTNNQQTTTKQECNNLNIEECNKNNTQKNEFFADVDSQLLNDYIQVRKAKRAPKVSKTVYDSFVRECKLAQITITDALRICVERNWVGFKADWYIKQPAKQSYQDGITIASKSIFKPEHLGHLGYEKEVKDE